jgi:hypothetical protein
MEVADDVRKDKNIDGATQQEDAGKYVEGYETS